MTIQDSEKKGVYVVGIDGARGTGDIEACESFEELNAHLKTLSTSTETDLMVLHGIITSARYIPAEVGRNVYIIVQDPDDPGSGCIYETDYPDSDDLVALITEIVTLGDEHYKLIDIDNVYVMYGYEVSTGFSVDEGELDEELFEQCEEVVKHIKEAPTDDQINPFSSETEDEEDALFTLYGKVAGKCE